MPEVDLPQAVADDLLALEKRSSSDTEHAFPLAGEFLCLPLESLDQREQFSLDVRRARFVITKATIQGRGRQVVVLARLDIDGPPHRNPDGEEVPCPHLHIYREGYGDKWAYPADASNFPPGADAWDLYQRFLEYFNVTEPPRVERRLF